MILDKKKHLVGVCLAQAGLPAAHHVETVGRCSTVLAAPARSITYKNHVLCCCGACAHQHPVKALIASMPVVFKKHREG